MCQGSHLLSCGTYIEHQLLLNQLLRCPLPLTPWAVSLVQPVVPVDGHVCSVRAAVDHCLAMLCTLLTPIRKREEFLDSCLREEAQNQWTLIDDEGAEVRRGVQL